MLFTNKYWLSFSDMAGTRGPYLSWGPGQVPSGKEGPGDDNPKASYTFHSLNRLSMSCYPAKSLCIPT